MTAGMMLLAPLWTLLVPDLDDRPGMHTMPMAADMAIGMGLWMRIRGHDCRMITEMSAVMAAPFALLLCLTPPAGSPPARCPGSGTC